MLNILAAKYQKEIALSFLSLFFISGLNSLKARAFNVVEITASANSAYRNKGLKNFPETSFNDKTAVKNSILPSGKSSYAELPSLPNYTADIMVKDTRTSEKEIKKGPYVKILSGGGPSQPEMTAFKPVGADNMVDPFTGDFSYNIPLLDVGGYPVNMFYNSGLTMDQEASWVGLGWNINPGTIMRNMRGLPDDFNGSDTIIKRQSIRPDITYGVSAGAGLKFAGFPIGSINVNSGLSFNNRLGLALELGIHPSLSLSKGAGDDKTSALSFGSSVSANLNINSRNGASITPSINASLSQNEAMNGRTGSLGLSVTQTSRAGVTGLHLDAGISKSKIAGVADASNYYKQSYSGTEAALSSSLSFVYPTIVPSIKNIYTRTSYNLSFSVGGEFVGANPHPRIAGYYMVSSINDKDQVTRHPAYGMLHYQNANSDINALLDFNRANDGVYTPNSPAIAMPVYTYDVFSINGEGTGGSFRATRNDLGYMRDPLVQTRDNAGSLGVDLGFGNSVHGGAEFSYAHTPSQASGWNVNNLAKGTFKFQENNGAYQAVYFKNPGEKTIPDAVFQNRIGGENLVRLKLANTASGTPTLLPTIVKYDAGKNLIGEKELQPDSVIKQGRDKRTQVISFLTAEEAARIGFDKNIYSYDPDSASIIFGRCDKAGIEQIDRRPSNYASNGITSNDYRKLHHISEINVLGTDGRKYVYGIPVYNIKQVDVSFSVDSKDGNISTGKANYVPGVDDTTGNTKGRDWFMNQEETPSYAHSFLLSALVSPNYVDVTGDGITEDDMGDAVKFNYSKLNKIFRWRTPTNSTTASYSEGLKTDYKDDKGHYVYGEREMWNLYSIESKNMVARFYIKNDRKDSREVLGQSGGVNADWGMQRLDKIELYSKGDLSKQTKAKPIKTIKFFQSYTLCKGVENSITGNGKLTLDSIWITYNGNQKKAKSRYVFYYPSDKNPDYDYNSNDRWGNYKPPVDNVTALPNNPASLSNNDYPYSVQVKDRADKYAASWVMNKVVLPSGGVINVDFEADDYGYVQNKKAASMFTILGFGNKSNPTIAEQNNAYLYVQGGAENDYVYVKLTYPITSTDIAAQQKELTARYFENASQLFMKLFVKMPASLAQSPSEQIPIYADIAKYGIVPGTSGLVAYIQVSKLAGGSTPMVQQTLQFLKQQLPGKAYSGYDVSDQSTARSVVLALAGMISSVTSLRLGEDAVLKGAGKCREVEVLKSFVRLSNPNLFKYGGGLRVKKVMIDDSWNKMTNQFESHYGQEYKYTKTELINGALTTISSGVASWEPSVGGDENPHKEIMRYMNHNRGGPYDFGAIEMPLGEMFYPSPLVGYSRFEVVSIHRDTVKNSPTRQVTEFYTTKDFPFKSSSTSLSDPEANVKYEPSAILQLLKLDMKKAITQSQGFLVDMNDMNGKVKRQATYSATDPVNAVSYTENFYNVQRATDNTYKFNDIFPTISKSDGIVDNNSVIGKDIEIMADFREHKTETITTNISANFDFFFLGIFPVPITNILQPTIYEGTTYRSASILKVVNHYGILDSVVVIDKGSMVSTKNLLYDAETGNPLLTRTNNEHNKPVYNFSYPAHWAYGGMGPAYKNIDATFSGLTFRKGQLENVIDMSIFESGDELYVFTEGKNGPVNKYPCDGSYSGYLLKNTANKIWAVSTTKGGAAPGQWVFMDKDGNPYTAANVSMRIVRSGHKNFLDQTVGRITSLKNPVDASSSRLTFTDATNIINTTAATFKDHWRVDNAFYSQDSLVDISTYATVKKIEFSPSDYLNAGRKQVTSNDNTFSSSKDEFLLSRKWSKTSGVFHNSEINLGRAFLLFDYASSTSGTPLPANASLYKANLTMYSHTDINRNLLANTSANHPGYHNGVVSQTLRLIGFVKSLKGTWFPSTESSNWGNYVTSDINLSGKSGFIPGTLSGFDDYTLATDYNTNTIVDNRIDITDVVNESKGFLLGQTNKLGLAINVKDDQAIIGGKKTEFRCFWSKKVGVKGISYEPKLSYYYYICGDTSLANNYDLDPAVNQMVKCNNVKIATTFCFSKFTRKAINPYVEGVLGNWRVDTSFVYYGERKEKDFVNQVDTRTGGTIINYNSFWNADPNYLRRNPGSGNVWVWNSTITQYNRKGYEIENKDPLGRFNSGLYGYNQQLPIAVANNAKVREIMFDGFEDYGYQTSSNCLSCKPRRQSNFDSVVNYIDGSQQHTGLYSLRVDGNMNLNLRAPVIDTAEAKRGYALRIKIDSTSYNDTIVTPKGSGFRGSYYYYGSSKDCSNSGSLASATLQNPSSSPVTRQDEQISFPRGSFKLPAGMNNYDNFVVRWQGSIQPVVSGIYSFFLAADDGVKFTLTDAKTGIVLASAQRWNCDWGTNLTIPTSQPLLKGELYTVTIDYYENRESEFITVAWQPPGFGGFTPIPLNQIYSPEKLSLATGTVTRTLTWCTKLDSVQVKGNALTDTLSPSKGQKMVLSAWVKEGGNDCKCSTYVKNGIIISYNGDSKIETLQPTGNIIEGWQRYESFFTIPSNATAIKVSLKNYNASGGAPAYFDDVRIHPFNANLKSFVYHSSNLRLMAELDENNYASFYEYDDDGTLSRVKKETINGIKTVTETRSAMQKVVQ